MANKNYKKALTSVTPDKQYSIKEAIELAKSISFEKFDTSLNLSLYLNLDPKQADQNIRGTVVLPGGTGKTKKILAVVEDAAADEAEKAGADFVGGEQMLTKIQSENWFEFDVIVTTPNMMPKFAKYGKLLGTKGLMPNPKLGTVTNKIAKAIEDIKKGSIEYKVDTAGNINVLFGKKSFSTDSLVENYTKIFNTIKAARPSSVKGDFFKNVSISTTMGPGIKISFDKS